MANIFENAKFGDKFRTRDDRMAIYLGSFYNDKHFPHKIAVENCGTYGYPDDGTYIKERDYLDVVGKWQEPINEKELKELARHFADDEMNISIPERNGRYAGYQAGYRKAKEEQL